jgi:hypothetical protein
MSNHGWSNERRAKQAAAIRRWKPWLKSTGPISAAGKARVSTNAYKGAKRPRLRLIKAKLREVFRQLDELY